MAFERENLSVMAYTAGGGDAVLWFYAVPVGDTVTNASYFDGAADDLRIGSHIACSNGVLLYVSGNTAGVVSVGQAVAENSQTTAWGSISGKPAIVAAGATAGAALGVLGLPTNFDGTYGKMGDGVENAILDNPIKGYTNLGELLEAIADDIGLANN